MSIEIAVARKPTSREIWDPWITRSSTERPSSSVPSQNRDEGGSRGAPGALVTERRASGTSTSAKRASTTNTARIMSPATPILFFAKSLADDLSARTRRVRRTTRAPGAAPALTRVRSWGQGRPAAGRRPGWRRSPPPRTAGRALAAAGNPVPRLWRGR